MVRVKDVLLIITYLNALTGFAAVTQYLGIYYSVVFVALLLSAAYLDYSRIVRLPRWLLNTISVAVLCLSALRISPEYLIEPILDALIILVAIKLLEEKQFRDYMQVYGLCMFLLIGSSLISPSAVFLVYFLILVLFATAAMVMLAYFSHDRDMVITRENAWKLLQHAVLICCLSIPATAVFFIILPRTNYPLLSFLNKSEYAKTGFAGKVTLGEVSEMQEDNTVIFRAEMEQVPEESLYWRGLILDTFDGKSWRSSSKDLDSPKAHMEGRKIFQTIYLEPYGYTYLFALDRPTSITMPKPRHMGYRTIMQREHVHDRIRYQAASVISDWLPDPGINRDHYLQLPEGFSPRIEQLARNLSAGRTPEEQVTGLFFYLHSRGGFKYSLKDLPVSDNPVEEFLLEKKHGNCEYFASSLAAMLRVLNIPSRIVAGYRGGFYNKTGGYYLVLQKNAHVWVEAYMEGRGWVRLDPTPYSTENPAIVYAESLLLRLKLLFDSFNYYWNKFIINYDFSRQLAIINAIRDSVRNPRVSMDWNRFHPKHYLREAAVLLILAITVTGIFFILRRKEQHARLMGAFHKRMSAYGYRRRSGEGLEEFVARVNREDLRQKAEDFIEAFQEVYYKDREFSHQVFRQLQEQIRNL